MNEPIATNREAAFTPHLPSRLPFDWSLWAAPTIPPSYPPRAVCSPLQNAMVCHFAPHPPLTMSIHVGILSCVWALSCWSLLLCVVFEGALQGSNGCKQLGRWGVEIFATLLSLVRTVPGLWIHTYMYVLPVPCGGDPYHEIKPPAHLLVTDAIPLSSLHPGASAEFRFHGR